MTAVQGIIGGGMEYPMMTLIGGGRNAERLFGVTYHELGHMWFPMLVGQDEKAFTWMDEGLTSFNTAEGGTVFWKKDQWTNEQNGYLTTVRAGVEEPSMRHGDKYLSDWARGTASYDKPASVLHALRGMVGNELFYEAFREYARRWTNRHPMPWDLFNTFEDVIGTDLDWFWTSWLYEAWPLDQAITGVSVGANESVQVTVQDRGLVPMPTPVQVTYADGRVENGVVPVGHWLSDNREAMLSFPAGEVKEAVIDAGGFFPDVNRDNNMWPQAAE
jgi:aminopeptidase N